MDLKKAESKKQGHCYSKREEAARHDTINIRVVQLFKVIKEMKMLCNHSGNGWAGWAIERPCCISRVACLLFATPNAVIQGLPIYCWPT